MGELLSLLVQRRVTKETRPVSLTPRKTLGMPSSLTICSAAAELAIKNMAQTVLAEDSSQIVPSSVSSKGGLKTNQTQSIQIHLLCCCATICLRARRCAQINPFERAIGWCREWGVVREDCLSERCLRVSSAAAPFTMLHNGYPLFFRGRVIGVPFLLVTFLWASKEK